MTVIAVVDYDMGNLHSACKGLANAGATPHVTDSAKDIGRADAIVLPGVGAFDPAIQHLRDRDLISPLKDAIASGKPFLGICLGLQILLDGSEEGREPGLGIVPGWVRRFRYEPGITIPHMGWNQLQLRQPNLPLWNQLADDPWVYFVHSFYADPADAGVIAATTTHGSQTVTAAIARDNLMAVQFHPEKSSDTGLKLLANFVASVQAKELAGIRG
ncbi:imidazole glycerol phosphate synthase subunit HisH [Thermoleptolyngbya sichuanensis A183]|uniref:Imidazole glycerol phosphate synthase subunit HisH n=1 Tax=Thermoleptolyngbya sichuanensis A183 TaxID=2737172 RepID=A0A6M8BD37_9CYAN|nr:MULTISPECIES: imidazole glycerol phosphate synthase subunit HisH [Thermoleptolyngbya]MDG2616087.1 imidazole glycerol phosphate synthase subunit HisH [Thermoleptolyngbya sichuanensis XZ-Cy5]QKD82086.1 imidazole glycerol phosphate synthase subunit HisH [Thermoleptolyngbya sichuanensis A183]